MNISTKEQLKDFKEVLNMCFPLPPRNVPELLDAAIVKYPTELHYSYHQGKIIGGLALHQLEEGIYYVNWFSISPEFQRQGFGRKLIQEVHNTHKGIILLRTKNSTGFWQKVGYRIFLGTGQREYLYRICRDKETIVNVTPTI